jgi:hypothetical protein
MKVFLHCLTLLRHSSEGRKGEREEREEKNKDRRAVSPRDGAPRTGRSRAKPLRCEGVDLLPRPDWLFKCGLAQGSASSPAHRNSSSRHAPQLQRTPTHFQTAIKRAAIEGKTVAGGVEILLFYTLNIPRVKKHRNST